MADLVATRKTTLSPEEVMVRAVQFFTNERWRAQSQTNRIATFVGLGKVPWFQLLIAIILTGFLVLPGLLYYVLVIRKTRRLQNLVVTTSPRETGCDVVVTYPPHAQRYVDSFFAALPDAALSRSPGIVCGSCGTEIAQGTKFCTSCGLPVAAAAEALPSA